MRFTKMILAMSLALAFSVSHAADTAECPTPKPIPPHITLGACIGEQGWRIFYDQEQAKQAGHNHIGIMDAQGKVLLPAHYFSMWQSPQFKNLIFVMQDQSRKSGSLNLHEGILNTQLQWILPLEKHKTFHSTSSPVLSVMREENTESLYALFDPRTAQFLTPFKYTSPILFQDGMAAFTTAPLYKYGKENPDVSMGFINEKGEEIIPNIYTDAGEFSAGVNWVQDKDGERWLIDKTGKKLWHIPHHYKTLSHSYHGLMVVSNRFDKEAIVNHAGKEVIPFGQFDYVALSERIPAIFAQKDGETALLDLSGKEMVPLGKYDVVEDSPNENDKWVVFVKDGQIWHYDEQGKVLKTLKSEYVKRCAHVKLGAKHRDYPNLMVSDARKIYRNHVGFAWESEREKGSAIEGTCDDVKAVAPVRKKRKR